jgi:putative hemolysin
MTNLKLNILVFILLLFLSAFFSSAETAFTALSRIKLRSLVDQNVKGSKRLQFLLSYPKRLITVILIGNNVANVGASAMATALMTDIFNRLGLNMAAAIALVTGSMTFIILTFGEITPKILAMKNSSKWALSITPILAVLMILFYPLTTIFMWISTLISKLFNMPNVGAKTLLTEYEIKTILKLAEEDGILEKEGRHMMNGIFNVSEKIVREIMTPRTDSITLNITSTLKDAINTIKACGHSRIPIYEGNVDNIQGIIYAKDLLNISNPEELIVKDKLRKAVYIPETKNIEELLQQMKRSKFHMAIVLDEHGGTAGLVTFEDIIEEIVGDIQDEYDTENNAVIELNPGHYQVDGSVSLDELPDSIKKQLPIDQEDYDTVGGFVLFILGSLPHTGDSFIYNQLEIHIKKLVKHRIKTVEITLQT